MLYLVYLLRPTEKARLQPKAFKEWVRNREDWFYRGMEMASSPRWYVRTIGEHVHAIEHSVAFEDEAQWGRYRAALSERAKDPEWERRRCEQEQWWEILEARLLNDMFPEGNG